MATNSAVQRQGYVVEYDWDGCRRCERTNVFVVEKLLFVGRRQGLLDEESYE